MTSITERNKLIKTAEDNRSLLLEIEMKLDKCSNQQQETEVEESLGNFVKLQHTNGRLFWTKLSELGVTENDVFHLEHYIETNITRSPTLSKHFILRDKVIQIYVDKLVGDTEYLVANNDNRKVCSGSCTVMISPSKT